jgi:hypothetical protein
MLYLIYIHISTNALIFPRHKLPELRTSRIAGQAPRLSLPENIENLHKQEEKTRSEALRVISGDTALKDHLQTIEASLDTIYAFTRECVNQIEDELAIQGLGIRLFNAGASALSLMLAGYYQNSLMLLRDGLETGFLIDYFSIDRTKIQEWRQCDEKDRNRKFSPAEILRALDAHDKVTGGKRAQIYKLVCIWGASDLRRIQVCGPKRAWRNWPLFQPKIPTGLVGELVKHLCDSALVYAGHFPGASTNLLNGKALFLNDIRPWAKKYLGLNL